MSYFVLILFLTMNITGLVIMNVDKKRAIKHRWRISENTLWLVALCGGAIGAYAGMYLFRHKTKHAAFKIGFPILAFVEMMIYIFHKLVISFLFFR